MLVSDNGAKSTAAYNPAAHVLQVLDALRQAERDPVNVRSLGGGTGKSVVMPMQTWAEALSLRDRHVRTVLPALADFGQLVDEVAEMMKSESLQLFTELELGPTFHKIKSKIDTDLSCPAGAGMVRTASSTNSATLTLSYPQTLESVLEDSDWRSLKICDQFMKRGIGMPLTRYEVDGLAHVADSVRQDAENDKDLDEGIRQFIISNLTSIQEGLSEVPIKGVEPLRVVVEHAIATTALQPDLREGLQRSSVGRRFVRVLAAIGLAITSGVAEAVTQGLLDSPLVAEIVKALGTGG